MSGVYSNILKSGGKLIPKSITENSTYNAVDDNADGYSSVTVDVVDKMDMYITKTLERLRLNDVPSGSLSMITPGGNPSKNTIIKSVELPNNTDNIGVWQFARMTYLELFDAGYTHRFDNVCLVYNRNLKALVIRTDDTLPTVFNNDAISFHATGKIYVPKILIESYKTATGWSYWLARYQELYIAETIAEKEQMLISSDIPDGSMIVCDVDETYTVKGA